MEKSTEYLTGVIERITFHAEETSYTVARLQIPKAKELTTVVGNFANIQAGQTLKLQGICKEYPKYGSQFQVSQHHETKPARGHAMEVKLNRRYDLIFSIRSYC